MLVDYCCISCVATEYGWDGEPSPSIPAAWERKSGFHRVAVCPCGSEVLSTHWWLMQTCGKTSGLFSLCSLPVFSLWLCCTLVWSSAALLRPRAKPSSAGGEGRPGRAECSSRVCEALCSIYYGSRVRGANTNAWAIQDSWPTGINQMLPSVNRLTLSVQCGHECFVWIGELHIKVQTSTREEVHTFVWSASENLGH